MSTNRKYVESVNDRCLALLFIEAEAVVPEG